MDDKDKVVRASFIGATHVLQHIVCVRQRKYATGESGIQSLTASEVNCIEEDFADKESLKSGDVRTESTAASASASSQSCDAVGQRTSRREQNTFLPEYVQSYFESGSKRKHTSDHTLSRLGSSRLQYADMLTSLQDVCSRHGAERKALLRGYQRLYNKWMYEMCCHNYNLLLHGVGSKRRLIDDFIASKLSDVPHVVVNGFFPSLTIKSILSAITETVLEETVSVASNMEHCELIRQYFESEDSGHAFLVVHDIDGMALRSSKIQSVLSLLASVRGFHLIASIDHINAHLLWDEGKVSAFNWLSYDVTTFDGYGDETSYENSLVHDGCTLQLSSLLHVMNSLTHNAREIFLLLVNHQLDNQQNSTYTGLSFPDLYQRCREGFLVNSDVALRSQLTEFSDHKLVRIKKGIDGVEYLKIPMDSATLAKFMETEEMD